MSITTEWADKDCRVIRSTYRCRWGPADFMANEALIQTMLASVEHPVDIMLDMTHACVPASMASHLPALVMDAVVTQPNAGLIIIVGTDPYVHHLWEIFRVMYRQLGQRVLLVETLEDAHRLIDTLRVRPTL
jgi:hypothetical protein